MKTEKNNAVEKVENIIAEKNGESPFSSQSGFSENNTSDEEYKMKEEREEKARQKAEEKEKKRKIKEEKEKLKAEKKQEKEKIKAMRKKEGNGGGQSKKGYIAAIVTLSVSAFALAVALTFVTVMPSANDTALEASYQKSFYDTVDRVNNIDLNLSKIIATEDKESKQVYLVDTAVNSELAENDLQQLPLADESKYYTTKLINQIGDYCKYLNKKLINGDPLSNEDEESLKKLYSANRTLKNALDSMLSGMGNNFSFSSMGTATSGNIVIDNFNELQNLSVQYPELIYDGPFSDGVDGTNIKGLSDNKIDKARAKEIFNELFEDMRYSDLKDAGMSEGTIRTFNFTAKVKNEILYAQISENDGKLIMFAYSGSCRNDNVDSGDAIEEAVTFLLKMGVDNMEPVWINLSNNVYTINFAYTVNDTVVYADLIKVRVCAETCMVIGVEATAYYTNHIERSIGSPSLGESAAQSKVSENIEIETSRLALVPIGNDKEVLCYEFSGVYDGNVYYVYIDAVSGRQVEMFKVVESSEGLLLM